MDLNATKHPQGQSPSRSFSTQNITAIHTRLALYKSCLKWGGDYRTTKDSMHWEIDRGSALVVKMAQSLVDSPRGKAVLSANPGAREIIL
jgi:hypothetical protein